MKLVKAGREMQLIMENFESESQQCDFMMKECCAFPHVQQHVNKIFCILVLFPEVKSTTSSWQILDMEALAIEVIK